jgi:hypothetical protein
VVPAAVNRITDTVEIDSVHWSDVGIAAGPQMLMITGSAATVSN